MLGANGPSEVQEHKGLHPMSDDHALTYEEQCKKVAGEIDWGPHLQWPPMDITCACGQHFKSHGKYLTAAMGVVTKDPCPGCGSHCRVRAARSAPERWTL